MKQKSQYILAQATTLAQASACAFMPKHKHDNIATVVVTGKRILLYTLFLTVLLTSCTEETGEAGEEFNRSQLLENIGSNIIVPAFATFSQSTMTLLEQAKLFAEAPSENRLTALQDDWKTATQRWEQIAMYDLGPMETQDAMTSISNFPTNTIAIEEAIGGGSEISEAYIASLGSSSKGLPAIEYLLFDKENGNEAVLNTFASDKRISFIVALCENLNTIAISLNAGWQPESGNYLATFTSMDGKDAGSSVVLLANQLIILTESVKNKKVGIPLGKKSLGQMLPKDVEAWRSGISLALIAENITAIDNVFRGKSGTVDGIGFDNYLDQVNAQYEGAPLSQAIAAQLTNISTAQQAISLPLQDALTAETAQVEKLYDELQRLVVLLKTDMMSSLGLLVTFSDSDGD